MVQHWLKSKNNRILISILLLLVNINVAAILSDVPWFINVSKALIIPVFLMYYILINRNLNFILTSILFFLFFADLYPVLSKNDSSFAVTNLFSFFAFVCLLGIAIAKIKNLGISKRLGYLLGLTFLINLGFLVAMGLIMQFFIQDGFEILSFGIKMASLIGLTFLSLIAYLGHKTKEASMFLLMAMSFTLSTMMIFMCSYYRGDEGFLILERMSSGFGTLFLFSFIFEQNFETDSYLIEAKPATQNALA